MSRSGAAESGLDVQQDEDVVDEGVLEEEDHLVIDDYYTEKFPRISALKAPLDYCICAVGCDGRREGSGAKVRQGVLPPK